MPANSDIFGDVILVCRSCQSEELSCVVDLGMQPVSNAFIPPEAAHEPETYYPLSMYVCAKCKLAQLLHEQTANHHFNDSYVYFSSTSAMFVEHARQYVEMISKELDLGSESFVVEAASNDGYLLQHFEKNGVPHLGVEPSGSTAEKARSRGVDTRVDFFSVETAKSVREERGPADLVLGNNVLAHVPDVNDFLGGISVLLKDNGTATLEFPHLLKLIEEIQFDTIYHEHYSYLSLTALIPALKRQNLRVYKVQEVNVHGGSLRIFCTSENSSLQEHSSVKEILEAEDKAGINDLENYSNFQSLVDNLCRDANKFLIEAQAEGKQVVGYGAAAKGNTFLNYCGVKPYLMQYVCDLTPAKQGKLLPGTRIPVFDEDKLRETKPDYIFILPWNWREEIAGRLEFTREWGCKMVVAVPHLDIF